MLVKRTLIALLMLPVGILAIQYGGWFYALVILVFVGLAAWEYQNLMRLSGLQPAGALVVAGTLALILQRQINGYESGPLLLTLIVLLAMVLHLVAFERGRERAATDLGATLLGVVYLGWIGAYLISLRSLPLGNWWTFLALLTVWAGDIAAYLVGVRWGRRPLSPRLSPKKTWEGYWASIAAGLVCGSALGWLFPRLGGDLPAWSGLWIGLAMGALPTLGDLGESMIKRQAGAKDSSQLLPGHGGFFDRIDSWLWGGVISYYMIVYFWPV